MGLGLPYLSHRRVILATCSLQDEELKAAERYESHCHGYPLLEGALDSEAGPQGG